MFICLIVFALFPISLLAQSDLYHAVPWVPKLTPKVDHLTRQDRVPHHKHEDHHEDRHKFQLVYADQTTEYIQSDHIPTNPYRTFPPRPQGPPPGFRSRSTTKPGPPQHPYPAKRARGIKEHQAYDYYQHLYNQIDDVEEQEQVDVSLLEEGAVFDPTLVTVGDWAAQWDELENGWYFYNFLTGVSTWEQPEELKALTFENPFSNASYKQQNKAKLSAARGKADSPDSRDSTDLDNKDKNNIKTKDKKKKKKEEKEEKGIFAGIQKAFEGNLKEESLYKNVAKDFVETFLLKAVGWSFLAIAFYASTARKKRSVDERSVLQDQKPEIANLLRLFKKSLDRENEILERSQRNINY